MQATPGDTEMGLDFSLFSAGGPFAQFAGPALVVGRNAVVLAANEPAQPLVDLLQGGGGPELRTAIDAALEGRAAQINPLLLAPGDTRTGGELAVDLSVLPWGKGAAALLLGRDVTLERSLRHALVDSRQRYKDLVEVCGDFAWETDAEGRFVFVSPRGALGYEAAELIGRTAADLSPDDAAAAATVFCARTPMEDAELWMQAVDATAVCLIATCRPLTGSDGWLGARGVCRDVTEAREREVALERARHRERLLGYLLRIVREELEPAAMLSAAAEELVPAFGLAGAAVLRREGDDYHRVAAAGRQPPQRHMRSLLRRLAAGGDAVESAGRQRGLHAAATCYRDRPNGAIVVWHCEPPTAFTEDDKRLLAELAAQLGVGLEQLAREEELARLTSTDPLTGLGNRRGFLQALERRLRQLGARADPAALFYIDLDNFKLVNDGRGHQAGDEALQAVARLLRHETRQNDLAARLGGDEFALFVEQMPEDAARRLAARLNEAAACLAELTGDPAKPLSLSIGAAIYDPATREDAADLVNRADAAMYQAKRNGKAGLAVAAPARER